LPQRHADAVSRRREAFMRFAARGPFLGRIARSPRWWRFAHVRPVVRSNIGKGEGGARSRGSPALPPRYIPSASISRRDLEMFVLRPQLREKTLLHYPLVLGRDHFDEPGQKRVKAVEDHPSA